jgi:hypothetical protein
VTGGRAGGGVSRSGGGDRSLRENRREATRLAGAGVEEDEESALVAQASLPAEAVPSLPAEPVLSLPAETGGAAWTGETAARQALAAAAAAAAAAHPFTFKRGSNIRQPAG